MLQCSFSLAATQLVVKMTSALQKSQCCSATSAAKLQRNFRFRLWHVAEVGFRGVGCTRVKQVPFVVLVFFPLLYSICCFEVGLFTGNSAFWGSKKGYFGQFRISFSMNVAQAVHLQHRYFCSAKSPKNALFR